jgi:excisionase family DNA binding protein
MTNRGRRVLGKIVPLIVRGDFFACIIAHFDKRGFLEIFGRHLNRRWIAMGGEPTSISANERIALRIRDASIVSGLSRSTLYELLKSGKIRAVKIGGRRLILRESLEALLLGSLE